MYQAITGAAATFLSTIVVIFCVGIVSLVPGLGLCSFGFVLLGSASAASGTKIAECFVGANMVAKHLAVLAAIGFWVGVVILSATLAESFYLIHPNLYWLTILPVIVFALVAIVQIGGGLASGGEFRHFFAPHCRTVYRAAAARHLRVTNLIRTIGTIIERNPLVDFLLIGCRAFVGSVIWLSPSVFLMYQVGTFVPFLGVAILAATASILPMLQTHMVVQNRLWAMFDVRFCAHAFRRAPISWLAATALLLVLTFPAYLLRIENAPRDALWITTIMTIIATLPGRLALGVAYRRTRNTTCDSGLWVRVVTGTVTVAITVAYASGVFLAQYVIWDGRCSLLFQHALLLPMPIVKGVFWPAG